MNSDKIEKVRKDYTDKIKRFEDNLKNEINNNFEIFKTILNKNNAEPKTTPPDDHPKFYIVNYSEK